MNIIKKNKIQLGQSPKHLSDPENTDNERLKTPLFIAIICLNYSTIWDSLVNMVKATFFSLLTTWSDCCLFSIRFELNKKKKHCYPVVQIHEGFGNIATCWQAPKKRLKLKK